MLRKLNKIGRRRKGQNTAEYAILIALVVAAVIAMQTFVKRGLQARMFSASKYMANRTNVLPAGENPTLQYEPYYLSSDYDVTKDSREYKELDATSSFTNSLTTVTRAEGGFKTEAYSNTEDVGEGMEAEAP